MLAHDAVALSARHRPGSRHAKPLLNFIRCIARSATMRAYSCHAGEVSGLRPEYTEELPGVTGATPPNDERRHLYAARHVQMLLILPYSCRGGQCMKSGMESCMS